MTSVALASIIFLVSPSRPDELQEEKLPEGYSRIEKEGFVFFVRPGEEEFVLEALPDIKKFYARAEPFVRKSREHLSAVKIDPKVLAPLSLDHPKGTRLYESVRSIIEPSPDVEKMMRENWEGVLNVLRNLSQAKSYGELLVRRFSYRVYRVATYEDIKAGKIPFIKVNKEGTKEEPFNFTFKVGYSEKKGIYLSDSPESIYPQSDFILANVLLKGGTPWDRDWKAYSERGIRGILARAVKDIPQMMGRSGLNPTFFTEDPAVLSFRLAREAANTGILKGANLRDTLSRWFSDGAATNVTHEAIRKVFGDEAADRALLGPAWEDSYKDGRPKVNLLAWAMDNQQEYFPLQARGEHHYYAAKEIRGLVERRGIEILKTILAELKKIDRPKSPEIIAVIKRLTGEDWDVRLSAYLPELPKPEADLEREITGHVEKGNYEPAAALARMLVAAHPRSTAYRHRASEMLLNSDAKAHLGEFLFHFSVYLELMIQEGKEGRLPPLKKPTADGIYAIGRVFEHVKNRDSAAKAYRDVLKFDPNHKKAKKRLEALNQEPKE